MNSGPPKGNKLSLTDQARGVATYKTRFAPIVDLDG